MTENEKFQDIQNSLTGLFATLSINGQSQLSQTATQYLNLRYYLISNDRNLLSHMYAEHGIVQTLVDQPVDDAFRGSFDIQTDQIEPEELTKLEQFIERNRVVETIKQAVKWSRLYGGGAMLIMTDQKPDTPLDIQQLNEDSNLSFKSVDLWELYSTDQNTFNKSWQEPEYYFYYDVKIHKSRVYRIDGKEPPSFIRARLRGWGMSELEKLVRSINQYMKNQDVVFELMDEAKVDVYGIDGFNSALMSSNGTNNIAARIQIANQMKNFQNALVMDVADTYEQKNMNFAGLSDLLKQIREGIAADLKMPVTKLFGISSSGFNSGEDDIENYNAMIESEIRSKVKFVVTDIIGIICQKLYGVIPDDLGIQFPELRMMSTEQQEIAKTNEFNRVISSYQSGLIDGQQAQQAINRGDLLPISIDEDGEVEQAITDDFLVSDSNVES